MGWFKDACNWVKDKVSSGYNKLKSFFSSNDNPTVYNVEIMNGFIPPSPDGLYSPNK